MYIYRPNFTESSRHIEAPDCVPNDEAPPLPSGDTPRVARRHICTSRVALREREADN